jgi:hypothetical protein
VAPEYQEFEPAVKPAEIEMPEDEDEDIPEIDESFSKRMKLLKK